jgi:methionyl aminopeptidase
MKDGTVSIRTAEEVAMARRAGHLAADVLGMIAKHIRPGVTTDAIDLEPTVTVSRGCAQTYHSQ